MRRRYRKTTGTPAEVNNVILFHLKLEDGTIYRRRVYRIPSGLAFPVFGRTPPPDAVLLRLRFYCFVAVLSDRPNEDTQSLLGAEGGETLPSAPVVSLPPRAGPLSWWWWLLSGRMVFHGGPWLPGATDMPAYRLAVCVCVRGDAHGVVLTQGDAQQLHIKSSQVYLSWRLHCFPAGVAYSRCRLDYQALSLSFFYCPSVSSFTGMMQAQKLRASNLAAVLVLLEI